MGYTITRNYDTDYSRSNVRSILANVAHELADAEGTDIPTKSVFEEPDVEIERENRFSVPVRPTVTDAGFEPEELVPFECTVRGAYIRVLGTVSTDADSDERDMVHVRVLKEENANTLRVSDLERTKEIRASAE